jgi:maleate cis-trans isomerase
MGSLIKPTVQVHVVHTTVQEDAHREDALRETGHMKCLIPGAQALREQGVDVIMWACTSGSFVFGLEGARKQSERIGECARLPTSSTSLAFVAALKALAIDRVAIGATYPRDVTLLFQEFLVRSGSKVVRAGSLGIMSGQEVSALTKDDVVRLIRTSDHRDAQAILLPDTALHTAGLVDDLEDVSRKTVLTANQVTIWQALRLAAHPNPTVPTGLGSLFRTAL